jgi:glycosyltransferase involved in cell wall biosynthesis
MLMAVNGVLLLLAGGALAYLAYNERKLFDLADVVERHVTASVSAIVPARNEEHAVRRTLEALLGQTYANIEVIVLDDRSTDGTRGVIEQVAQEHRSIRLVPIDAPPPVGWLGKNHALFLGAREASGEFLLFIDADVILHPDALRKAMSYVDEQRLDHLAVAPQFTTRGALLCAMVGVALGWGALVKRPWKARDPRSRASVGSGSFNLLRREVYLSLDVAGALAGRPDDDVRLGELVKHAGYRQDCLIGRGMVFVAWYQTVWDMVHGLDKVLFAIARYRVSLAILWGALFLGLFVLPVVLVFVTPFPWTLVPITTLVLFAFLYTLLFRKMGIARGYAILFPLAGVAFLFVLARAVVVTLARGGIVWRGTYYPLSTLRMK